MKKKWGLLHFNGLKSGMHVLRGDVGKRDGDQVAAFQVKGCLSKYNLNFFFLVL